MKSTNERKKSSGQHGHNNSNGEELSHRAEQPKNFTIQIPEIALTPRIDFLYFLKNIIKSFRSGR